MLPERPRRTERLGEEELAALVSRDAMIGTARAMTMRPGPEVTGMTGAAALPRRNGELVFEAPWQGRAFAWRWR